MQELFEGLSVTLSNEDKSSLKDRIDALKKEWQKGAQNDEQFVGDLRVQAEGKVYASVERWLKKATGLKFDDISADIKGGERFKEMLNVSISSIKETKDATNQDLQDQLLNARDEIRRMKDEEIPEIEAKFKTKFDQKNIDTKLVEHLSTLQIVDGKMNPATIFTKAVLKDRFKLVWDEENNDVRIKTKQDLEPVIDDKTASTTDVLRSIIDEGGFMQKSNGTTTTVEHKPGARRAQPGKTEFSENARKMAESLGIDL